MPFARPSLTALRQRVAQDIAASLPGADALLRYSNLGVLGEAQAGLANLHYGYLDWIAMQSNPFTATDEFLEAWAALVRIFRKAASVATGKVIFSGTNGVTLPSGTFLVRGDGIQFITTSSGVVSGGTVAVNAAGIADSSGLTGGITNMITGTVMILAQSIAGIQSNGAVSTAFTGGADLESDDNLRTRMLQAYQNQPQGGDSSDYIEWALEVAGVTRAWCVPNGFGAGTVVVYTMFDNTESAYGGFPQGTNGRATLEPRDTIAAGDQLLVADHIYPLQPVTALVYLCAPIAQTVNFTISGIPTSYRSAVTASLANLLLREGTASGGKITLAHIWSVITAVSGIDDFVVTVPAADIVTATGYLPVMGTVTYI